MIAEIKEWISICRYCALLNMSVCGGSLHRSITLASKRFSLRSARSSLRSARSILALISSVFTGQFIWLPVMSEFPCSVRSMYQSTWLPRVIYLSFSVFKRWLPCYLLQPPMFQDFVPFGIDFVGLPLFLFSREPSTTVSLIFIFLVRQSYPAYET